MLGKKDRRIAVTANHASTFRVTRITRRSLWNAAAISRGVSLAWNCLAGIENCILFGAPELMGAQLHTTLGMDI
jgi:hypothetical protein